MLIVKEKKMAYYFFGESVKDANTAAVNWRQKVTNEPDYISALEDLEAESEWVTVSPLENRNELVLVPAETGDYLKFAESIPEEEFREAAGDSEYCGAVAKMSGDYRLISPIATKTFTQCIKLSGTALDRMSNEDRVDCFQKAVNVSDSIKILVRKGHVMAFHQEKTYAVMEASVLARKLYESLERQFGTVRFGGGYVMNNMTTSTYILEDYKDTFEDTFQRYLSMIRMDTQLPIDYTPAVCFRTSDTADYQVSVRPVLVTSKGPVYLGGIKEIRHDYRGGSAPWDEYDDALSSLTDTFDHMVNMIEGAVAKTTDDPKATAEEWIKQINKKSVLIPDVIVGHARPELERLKKPANLFDVWLILTACITKGMEQRKYGEHAQTYNQSLLAKKLDEISK